MDIEDFLKLDSKLVENYSKYLDHVDTEIMLNEEEYLHLIRMLLAEIEGNKEKMQDQDPTYVGFAKQNVIKLTSYLAWIIFFSSYKYNANTGYAITIPQRMAMDLFLHLLAFDVGRVYVI